MSKKNAKTAVYFFAMECKEKRKMTGSLKDIIEAIYPEWKSMSPHERAPYQRQLQEYKSAQKLEKTILPNSKSANLVDDPADIESDRRVHIKSELEEFFEGLETNLEEAIKKQRWYFIKFITFCKCDLTEEDYNPYYVLGEVGLVEYSLQEGITNQYHAFIKPNKIPLGYRSYCMDSSRDVHKIPLDKNEYISQTYSEIYTNIEKFLQKKEENNFYVPIFSLSKDVEETKFGLKYLKNSCMTEHKQELHENVYDLECLVAALFKNTMSFYSAHEMLTRYTYDYSSNTKCAFHDEAGTLHCALGIPKRYCYLISDHLCPFYNIPVTDKHLPVETPLGTIVYNNRDDLDSSYNRVRSNRYRLEGEFSKRWADANALRTVDEDQDDESMSSRSSNPNNAVRMPSYDIRADGQTVPVPQAPRSTQSARSRNRTLVSDKLENACEETQSISSSTNNGSDISRYRPASEINAAGKTPISTNVDLAQLNDAPDSEWVHVQIRPKAADSQFRDINDNISEKSAAAQSTVTLKSNASQSSKSYSDVTSSLSSNTFMGRGRGIIPRKK